ncbi:hypothetical protein IM697_18590 [Streptomyces ferrugineus]|uniref:Uncharacterized protein n=1 Tax=Streptomyces ferrugineus TaxID=1413221 RepID=A0A7M2SV60_9ACTN|nr:hypothetical protein [Streptomyces ferrugineus]QOV40230.1 hypothetical protein IM697_18590 [Streptomyces ferrugineus]
MAETQTTGIKNADELITLAAAFGLTVTVETTDRETLTSYVVRFAIPVPVAYAGTELGRTIAGDSVALLWTKAKKKGARGCLVDATVWSVVSHRKVRTLREVTAAVETLGHNSAKYARDTAPLPDDVVDTLHAVFVDDRKVHPGIPASHVRTIVKNRRFRGWTFHQDDENAICIESRRYVPETVTGPTPEDVVDAPHAVYDSHNDWHKDIPAADVRHMITVRRAAGQSSHQGDDGTITATGIRFVPQPAGSPSPARQHVRIVNGGTPEIVDTRAALHEINTAMMQPGKRAVREMSASGSSARIVYRDPARGTVDLRPATAEDLAPAPIPAAAAPLFAAMAAYEATMFCTGPRDLEDLAHQLLALGKVAPTAHHLEVGEAHADVEGAWEALRTAPDRQARTTAHDKARAAVERARAVILAVAPHAHRMHGTDVPGTAEEIRAAAVAYNAVGSTPEELSAVETGTPQVRVRCSSDSGTGWKVTATITAGVDTPQGFLPAHPAIVEKFRKRDGREDAAANARRVIGALFRVNVPVEYVRSSRG